MKNIRSITSINVKSFHFIGILTITIIVYLFFCYRGYIELMGQQHVLNFPTIAWALFTSTLFGIYGSAPFLIPLWFLYMVLFFLIRRLHYARKGRANKHSVAQIIVKSMLFFIVLQYFVILACFVIDCGILYDDPMRWQTSKFANWPVFVVSRFYNFAFPNTKGFFSLTWTPFGLLPFAVIQIDLLGWALLGVASGSLTSLILKWRNRNAGSSQSNISTP